MLARVEKFPAGRARSTSTRDAIAPAGPGLVLARRGGLQAHGARARRARRNEPRSFVYHFGSRDAFNDELMERWFAAAVGAAAGHWSSTRRWSRSERLRRLVLCLLDWVAENRAFVGHLLLLDVAAGGGGRRFMRTLAAAIRCADRQRHP